MHCSTRKALTVRKYLKPQRGCGVPVVLSPNGKLDAEFGDSQNVYHVHFVSKGRIKRVSCGKGSVTMPFYLAVRYQSLRHILEIITTGITPSRIIKTTFR